MRWSIIWQALCWGKQLLKWWCLKNLSVMNVPKFCFPFTCLKKIMKGDMLGEQCLLYPPPLFFIRPFICRFFFFTYSCNNCIIYERLGHYLEMRSKSCQGEYWRTKDSLWEKFSYTASDIFYDVQLFSWMCFVFEMGNWFTFWICNFL